jgi:hypothetical protein
MLILQKRKNRKRKKIAISKIEKNRNLSKYGFRNRPKRIEKIR